MEKEYMTEEEARAVREIFDRNLESYKKKKDSATDEEWLAETFRSELPEVYDEEEAREKAHEIVDSIEEYEDNLGSVDEAYHSGISKEKWLADKIQEASVGMAVSEYGQVLQSADDFLYQKNMELAEALSRSSDGHIMMSNNLDGNIAENLIADTTELSAHLQGKNVKVEVLESFTANSVDVRATNLDTGKYQNYQLKFGKDAKATIDLLERGDYRNQRVVVPSEQMEEVQAHFREKGSVKTITDHIDAWGAKGKSFTKEEMKKIQIEAQESGNAPVMDYNYYQTKDLALWMGKNAATMAVQSAAVTTGLTMAAKIYHGEDIRGDEMVEIALRTGADTSVKTITAATLEIAVKKGIVRFIPKMTPAGTIANIACVGVENVKVLGKIASGELSLTRGIDQMGRTTVSMAAGLWGMSKVAGIGALLTVGIPVIGIPLAIATGFVGGLLGYHCGSKVGDAIYHAGKKVAGAARKVARAAVNGLKSAGRAVASGIKAVGRGIARVFGR